MIVGRTSRFVKFAKVLYSERINLPASQIQSLTSRINFKISSWNQQKLSQQLDQSMQTFRKNMLPEDKQNIDFFKKEGWSINYQPKQTLFQYTKTTDRYEVKTFTYVKANPPNDPEAEKPQAQDEQKTINYSQLLVWVRKVNQKRWMVAEMGVVEGAVQLLTIHFTDCQPGVGWERWVYPGPDVSSVPAQVLGSIDSILGTVGLRSEMIMNMVIHASSKVDELEYQWLKHLKEVIT